MSWLAEIIVFTLLMDVYFIRVAVTSKVAIKITLYVYSFLNTTSHKIVSIKMINKLIFIM